MNELEQKIQTRAEEYALVATVEFWDAQISTLKAEKKSLNYLLVDQKASSRTDRKRLKERWWIL